MQQVRIAHNGPHIIRERISDKKTSNGRALGEVRIRRGIFQDDHSSTLLFLIFLMPLLIFERSIDASPDIRKVDPS